MARELSLFFAAGALGGLANGLVVFAAGEVGATAALGIRVAPDLTPAWLYPRVVWGGLWGLAFVVPAFAGSWWRRGLAVSLAPSLVQLLAVFPVKAGKGVLGLELGLLTPVFVLFANVVWGLVASWWIRATRG